ncbi:MAG: DNA glycosylase [Oscillospiraceae bacterium]|nr:DNA glycosylase [Oscillospiraceae bacterium]
MELEITDDLDLGKIADSGQCFRIRRLEDGLFRFVTGDKVLYIRSLSPGRFEAECSPGDWDGVWAPYFDLKRSYSAIRGTIPAKDAYMRRAAGAGSGIRILHQSPWETLVSFIISQRKSIPAIQSAVELLCERYGDAVTTPYETVRLFPLPAQLSSADTEALAGCKLGYRTSYVLDAVARAGSGALDMDGLGSCGDAELIERLKEVRGVGNKVANCVALFAYGRTALAPVDTWISKVIEREYGGTDPFPAYGAAAGIMQQYVFYYALNHKSEY